MSETSAGDRKNCVVCHKPLEESWLGWRHTLYCSVECEQLAARWQSSQIATAAGHHSVPHPGGAGSAAAPPTKGSAPKAGHAGGAPAKKPAPH
jgi:hypothetical protein